MAEGEKESMMKTEASFHNPVPSPAFRVCLLQLPDSAATLLHLSSSPHKHRLYIPTIRTVTSLTCEEENRQ